MPTHVQPWDHMALVRQIDALIDASLRGGYSVCVELLVRAMHEQFPSLTHEHNPVTADLVSWNRSQLGFIIQEYSGFSNAAIHMFLEARIRNRWPALTKEIIRNMDEEMGALTGGIPHLELMRHGYRMELGLETDGVERTPLTHDFIGHMDLLLSSHDNAALAGALLAFETTAVEEFRVVELMLRRYKQLTDDAIAPDSLTGMYISGHVAPESAGHAEDPELGHFRGMTEAIGANVTTNDLQPLVRGFLSVCLELSRWWQQIATEACHREIRLRLAQRTVDRAEIYFSLRHA